MNRIHSAWEDVQLIAQLADLKDTHYQHTLVLGALIELLVDKGILTGEEIQQKIAEFESFIPDPANPIS